MADQLVIVFNGEAQMHYDRGKPLPDHQRRFLDKMDAELQQGISINGQYVENPQLPQRAQFAALNLIQAIESNEEQKAAAMCAYLAVFLPDLKQVKAEQNAEGIFIDLVFDQDFVKEVKVQLTSLKNKPN